MIDDILPALILIAAITTGVLAGIYFAFSAFLMRALDRLPPEQSARAMQVINEVILNPAFGLIFFGSAAGSALVAISTPFRWDDPGAGYLLIGGLVAVIGSFLVTVLCNVPLNGRLATAQPGSAAWSDYSGPWSAWNHVRTVSSLIATALLIIGFRIQGG
jgi:uncharacterized membrane protein